MASEISIKILLERNKVYAESSHVPFPDLMEVSGRPGMMGVVIVSCVDGRVQPENFLQLRPGEAFVLKTVAGHPANCLQDILVLDTLSPLKKLIIMHHTDCGASHVTDEVIKEKLTSRLPGHKHEFEAMSFGAFTNVEESLRKDVSWIRNHPYMREELRASIFGLLYDVKTGLVKEVDLPAGNSAKSEF